MAILHFSDAVAERGQQGSLADKLGIHQTAVSKAKRENRNIFIVETDDGVSAFEIKPAFNTNPDLDKISDILLRQLETA